MRIAFTGHMGTGKTTSADYLVERYKYDKYSFAFYVKKIATELFDMRGKDRALLQNIGSKIREINQDVWANYTMRELEKLARNNYIAIDDLRYTNEERILRKHGFVIIKINRKIPNSPFLSHPSETDIDLITSDYTIDNNKTFNDLHKQIEDIIKKESKSSILY